MADNKYNIHVQALTRHIDAMRTEHMQITHLAGSRANNQAEPPRPRYQTKALLELHMQHAAMSCNSHPGPLEIVVDV